MLAVAVPIEAIPLNDDTVTPGLLGFGFFVAMCVATFLLLRSMNKRMRKIQAPREADLKQQEWERAQQAKAAAKTDAKTDAKADVEAEKTTDGT